MHGFWWLNCARAALVDVERLPVHVLRAAQREMQQSRPHRRVAQAIDQDETAQLAAFAVRLEDDGSVQFEAADANIVEVELLRREMPPGC